MEIGRITYRKKVEMMRRKSVPDFFYAAYALWQYLFIICLVYIFFHIRNTD